MYHVYGLGLYRNLNGEELLSQFIYLVALPPSVVKSSPPLPMCSIPNVQDRVARGRRALTRSQRRQFEWYGMVDWRGRGATLRLYTHLVHVAWNYA